MKKKNIIYYLVLLGLICGVFFTLNMPKKESNYNQEDTSSKVTNVHQEEKAKTADNVLQNNESNSNAIVSESKKETKELKGEVEKTLNVKNANLFNDTNYNNIPLSLISAVSDLPSNVQNKINNIINSSQEIYMIKNKPNKVMVVKENSSNIRHGIDFVEIDIPSGHQTVSTFGYNGKIGDAENDIWEYENISKLPTKHTKYNKDGDIEFVEIWNYDSEEPIKYEMKNAEGKVISLRKETLENESNLRIEHIIYDKEGKTKANIIATYEGSDIKRFTYYNADKLSDSASVYSEYDDGMKVKETVYSSNLKVQNVYKSDYENGERKSITIFDDKDKKIGIINNL